MIDLRISTELSGSSTVDVTCHEDVDDDGTSENSATLTVSSSGETTHTFTDVFEESGGNTYWLDIQPNATSLTGENAITHYAELTISAAGGGGDPGGPTTIESFEDQDMSEYTAFDGSLSDVSFVTSPVKDGSYAAEVGDANVYYYDDGSGGLNAYPEAGDTIRYNLYHHNEADDYSLLYGVQDSSSFYELRVDVYNDVFEFLVYNSGSASFLASDSSITLSNGVWHEIEISWNTDESHDLSLFDDSGNTLSTLSYGGGHSNDPGYTSGGIGGKWLLGSGGSITVDNIRLE